MIITLRLTLEIVKHWFLCYTVIVFYLSHIEHLKKKSHHLDFIAHLCQSVFNRKQQHCCINISVCMYMYILMGKVCLTWKDLCIFWNGRVLGLKIHFIPIQANQGPVLKRFHLMLFVSSFDCSVYACTLYIVCIQIRIKLFYVHVCIQCRIYL